MFIWSNSSSKDRRHSRNGDKDTVYRCANYAARKRRYIKGVKGWKHAPTSVKVRFPVFFNSHIEKLHFE